MKNVKEMHEKWRSRLIMLLTAVFCAVVFACIPADVARADAQGTVTASSANIRSSADASSKAVASVLKGAKLTIIEETTGSDGKTWYKVWVDADTTGYVRSDLVSKEGSVPTNNNSTSTNTTTTTTTTNTSTVNTNVTVNTDGVEQVQPVSASVTKDRVRVRADSSTNSSIVTAVKKDVVLTVSGTKAGSASDTWYLVSFMVDGTNVTGFIRSDYVTLNGELLPPENTTVTPEPAEPTEPEPTEPVEEPKAYDTTSENGEWYLVDNDAGKSYPITLLIEGSEKNADALEKAQKKLSGQTAAIVILAILLVVLALGITLLIFRLRDIMEEDGLDLKSLLGINGSNRGQSRTARRPVTRPSGQRPAGSRPVSERPSGSRPSGQRPAGSRPVGERPAGQRPAGSRPVGERPAGQRPVSERPVGSRPVGERPVGSRPVETAENRPAPVPSSSLEREAAASVEKRNLEKDTVDTKAWKSKNFMADDDEFEFEFLNWDGEEEK